MKHDVQQANEASAEHEYKQRHSVKKSWVNRGKTNPYHPFVIFLFISVAMFVSVPEALGLLLNLVRMKLKWLEE